MKKKLAISVVLVAALFMSTFTVFSDARPALAAPPNDPDDPTTVWPLNTYSDDTHDNVILRWNDELLQTIRANPATTGPTITARALGVLHTATYDAWAAYDPVAKATRPDGATQQPAADNTVENKNKAISFAAYRTLVDLFPARQADYFKQMEELGYADLNDSSAPAVVGTKAADAVIRFRNNDGSNQLGTDPRGTPGVPYSDTTGYKPKNEWNKVNDRWAWQPLCVPLPPPGATSCPSGSAVQKPLTPHWPNVTPFALTSAWQYKVPGPPRTTSGYSTADIVQEYVDSKDLDDEKKAKAEYWADGPRSEFPPGHFMVFAQALSRKRGHSLDDDTKLFFALGNAVLDASIASWAPKYKYDFVRPITAIREHYRGKNIRSWLGPYKDYGTVKGENWIPYQAPNVVSPPFPEYTSGHSTFSGAASQVLTSFTGSTAFGASVTIKAGTSLFEPRTATHPGYPKNDVTLTWGTFWQAGDEAGWSRRYGGIHFKSGDEHGRTLGKMVGTGAWSRAKLYINGTLGT